MKAFVAAAAFIFAATAGTATALSDEDVPPPWAWGFTTPPPPGTPRAVPALPAALDSITPLRVPGSKLSFTRAQIANPFGPADWFPDDHPTMPDVVAHGRESAQPQIWACGYCHYPNGKGRPENANIAGLSYDYIVQQLMDFRSGARQTSDPRKANTAQMAGFASDDGRGDQGGRKILFINAGNALDQSRGERDRAENSNAQRDDVSHACGFRSRERTAGSAHHRNASECGRDREFCATRGLEFVAYVPTGSLKKGRALVENGVTASAGKVTPCTACHELDLRGLGPVPRLAGRSPSYIARQLYDMQHGNRAGTWTPLMSSPILARTIC